MFRILIITFGLSVLSACGDANVEPADHANARIANAVGQEEISVDEGWRSYRYPAGKVFGSADRPEQSLIPALFRQTARVERLLACGTLMYLIFGRDAR